VLVLADGSDGSICDFANFPQPECFAQPCIQGTAGFTLGDGQVNITVDGIDNPRAADNLSGSLVAELWALPAPFGERGDADGVQLAGVFLGSLAGQQGWQQLSFDLPLAARPAGTWHIALLLREWTAAGYVTRDFTDFPLPVSWAAEAAPVAEAETAAPAKPAKKPAAKKAAPKAAAKVEAGKVSINTASEAELAAIKGLSKTVAAAIVAARPFKQVDDLLTVKGVGAKLLDKLKGNLGL
jgi:competence ComEA-like helix-hairpin-helix protein